MCGTTMRAAMVMKKHSIFLYWLLLCIPTLIIGMFAFQLLRHEGDRIREEARSSAFERVRTIAETLQITVETVEEELTASLTHIPRDRLQEILTTWEHENPLIRNVFIWRESGLMYPPRGSYATREERRFAMRYDALFTGSIGWSSAVPRTVSETGGTAGRYGQDEQSSVAGDTAAPGLIRDIRNLKKSRHTLVDLARGKVSRYATTSISGKVPAGPESGWIPWFAENKLYILGWIERQGEGLVYGVELELMTLLSRLIMDFPASVPGGFVYALTDGQGHILHRSGAPVLGTDAKPGLSVSLAPHLPHWQVAVFFDEAHLAGYSGRAFVVLSGLMLGIFVVAVLVGGLLLLRQAQRNMEDARQKTSFVSNVSHELKTPLTSIRMYAELLEEGRVKDAGKKAHYLNVIVDETRRLTRLVNNVLDFGRLEQGRKQYNIEEIELVAFVHEVLAVHSMRIKNAGLAIHADLPEKACRVRTDRDAVEQVLLNLVDNAMKYAVEGGELGIALIVTDDACELQIRDRGPGVPLPHRRKIFEKFHRVDESLTARKPGSGLGLSIARRLMQDLGGNVHYEPRAGGGSSFVVTFPRQPGDQTSTGRKGDGAV